jgi:hypothetical protein
MSMSDATVEDAKKHDKKAITITVNTRPVVVHGHEHSGLEIKEAAKDQGLAIELDFLLTLEAHGHDEARQIADEEKIEVNKHSAFSCNDGEDDS